MCDTDEYTDLHILSCIVGILCQLLLQTYSLSILFDRGKYDSAVLFVDVFGLSQHLLYSSFLCMSWHQDALVEVDEKYRKAMVSNAQLDNEKNNLMYQVDTLKDSLMELEELLSESRRGHDDKVKVQQADSDSHWNKYVAVVYNIINFKNSVIKTHYLLRTYDIMCSISTKWGL